MQLNNYKELLTREGVKNTKNRNAILEILELSGEPLSAEEVFLKLKEEGISMCLSTVYRTFERLASKGLIVKSNIFDDGKARYQLNGMEHTHNIVCIGCHQTISFDECPVDGIEEQLMKKIGFDVTGHKFEIYGYCKECKAAREEL